MKKIVHLLVLFLTLNFQFSAQVPNSGFEDWSVDSLVNENPIGWQTSDLDHNNAISKTTDSYLGDFAMQVTIHLDSIPPSFEGSYASTWAISPNFVRNSAIGASFYLKCDSLSEYVFTYIAIYGRSGWGQCLGVWTTYNLIPTYSLIEIPFDLSKIDNSIHDSISIIIGASSPTNSKGVTLGNLNLKIDNIKLITKEDSVVNNTINVYPNPFGDELTISVNSLNLLFNFIVYDETGKIVEKGFSDTELTHLNTKNWRQGNYIIKLYEESSGNFLNQYAIVKGK
ncbi:MAG: T9SS type A sorting domain-containing protein [Bacteroidota bacterium]